MRILLIKIKSGCFNLNEIQKEFRMATSKERFITCENRLNIELILNTRIMVKGYVLFSMPWSSVLSYKNHIL